MLGLSERELEGASLGYAYTSYLFNENGKILSDNDLVYPVIYNGEIIAILEAGYDSLTSKYNYTFGKAYADELNKLCHAERTNASKKFMIGRIADKFFLTNGKQVDVILDKTSDEQRKTISETELKLICERVSESIDACYMPIS